MTAMWRLLAVALLLVPACLQAQYKIRVAVDVTDDKAGGRISSIFRSSLRGLGDVEVVGADENPSIVISGVVLCNGDTECRNHHSYAIALNLFAPLTGPAVRLALEKHDGRLATIPSYVTDSAAALLTAVGYRRVANSQVGVWGTQRYEQSAREFILELDSRCLEKERLMKRAFNEPERRDAIRAQISQREWMC